MSHRRTAALAAAALVLGLAGCTSAPADEPSAPASSASARVDQVPDVSGMLGAEAAETIEQVDMTVRFVATSDGKAVDDDDARTSLVVETYPKAGTDVRSDREVTVYVGTDTTVTAAPTLDAALDLTTDEGLCAADAELTNLELNDALAPQLGFPADRDARTVEQDDAIKAYKNAAFARACPERAS